MPKYTKYLQFDNQTIKTIAERDNYTCIFCAIGYHMENKDDMGYKIYDIMHYIPKSHLGLGVEQNGAYGCRYHHHLLDNGNKGLRDEMLGIFEEYLKSKYENWDKDKLVYKKYWTWGHKLWPKKLAIILKLC